MIQTSDEFVASNVDSVGSRVGDGQLADSFVAEFDEGWSPLQVSVPVGEDGGHIGGPWL